MLTPPRIGYHIVADSTAAGGAASHKIAVYEWGDVSRPPVVCVHGLSRNARDFDVLATRLSQHFRVIAVDMPGRGLSDWITPKEHYHLGTYAADIISLLTELKITQTAWVGTSMGGLLGMVLSAGRPGLISRMVINDIGPFVPKEALMRLAGYIGVKTEFSTQIEAEEFLKSAMASFGVEQKFWPHLLSHSIVMMDKTSARLAYDPNIAWSLQGDIKDVELWPAWNAITTPMMLVRGQKSDILNSETLREMRKHPALQKVIEIENVGHAPMLTSEHEISDILHWLKQAL